MHLIVYLCDDMMSRLSSASIPAWIPQHNLITQIKNNMFFLKKKVCFYITALAPQCDILVLFKCCYITGVISVFK